MGTVPGPGRSRPWAKTRSSIVARVSTTVRIEPDLHQQMDQARVAVGGDRFPLNEWMRLAFQDRCEKDLGTSLLDKKLDDARTQLAQLEAEKAEAEEGARAQAEKQAQKDQRAAQERKIHREQSFKDGVKAAQEQTAKGIPPSRALRDEGLDVFLRTNPELMDLMPDGPLKDAARSVVQR